MGNTPDRTVQTNTKLEDKLDPLSRKMWPLIRSNVVININADGSIPHEVQSKVSSEGRLYMTNYINPSNGKRTAITRINGQLISIELTQI